MKKITTSEAPETGDQKREENRKLKTQNWNTPKIDREAWTTKEFAGPLARLFFKVKRNKEREPKIKESKSQRVGRSTSQTAQQQARAKETEQPGKSRRSTL
jgi:hypothetical protein